MKTQHTPGPWYYSGTGCLVGGPDRVMVADTYLMERDAETRQANARLIAAAPDLLAALEGLIGDGEMIECNPDEGARCFLCRAPWDCITNSCKHDRDCHSHSARAAIAKARGQE